ncbi:MAG: hypothetical protein KAR42_10240 [candidate division Zixibacteria bacterium]|nr:hypothetical protein [candidate division Zixibacteria bacterium]
MARALILFSVALLILTGISFANPPQSLEQAKVLAKQTGKPILIEFYRDD